MTFPTNLVSATPAKYRFRLIAGDTDIICDPEPLEWASGTYQTSRDIESGGVFSTLNLESLTFVGNGAKLLKQLYADYEFNAKCELVLERWKGSTRAYVEFPNRLAIDFNFYETVLVGNFGIGIRTKAISTSIKTKFESRKDIEINLTNLVSVGEVAINDFPNLKKYLDYDATNVSFLANFIPETPLSWYLIPRKPGYVSYTSIPAKILSTDYIEVHDVSYVTKSSELWRIPAFFEHAVRDYTFKFSYSMRVDVTDKDSTTPWTIKLLEVNSINTIINEYTIGTFGDEIETINYNDSIDVSISTGNSLKFVVIVQNRADIRATIRFINFSILNQIVITEARTTEGIPVYEALERGAQLIMDEQYPFYSEKFGRTDIIYDSSGNHYSSSDQLTYAHIQTGLNQRGALLSDNNSSFALKYSDLLKTVKNAWNVGYGFEKINGQTRFRIEDYSHFFQDVEILDLRNRINKYDIVSAGMPELAPSELKSGFEDTEYLAVNGRGEPNTTNSRTTLINTVAKFDNVCPLRGDTKSILDNLAKDLSSEDTETDSKIFIVKTQANGDRWIPEKDTNIQILENSLFGEDLLNRYFLPTRMLIRHGNRIKCGLMKYLNSYLKFQKSDKLQNIVTTGEGYEIAENEDVLINDLDAPLFKAMSHTVKVATFDWSDMELIEANPYGYLTFTDEIAGYVLKIDKPNNKAEAVITIIEKA